VFFNHEGFLAQKTMIEQGRAFCFSALMKKIDPAAFRQIMGRFATGIAVVTAQDAALGKIGLTVNSLTSVSLDPPLILFCIDKRVHIHQALKNAGSFAVNLLARGQEDISRHFASRHSPAPKGMWEAKLKKNCPILRGTLGYALCAPRAFYKGGDHTIFLCEATEMKKNAADEPLLYFQGTYQDLGRVTSASRK